MQRPLPIWGGLTHRTSLDDVAARSDTAIVAVLAGDDADAKRYLAYTGAGRVPKEGFGYGASMRPPPCEGGEGLRPDDVGVVEFSIDPDGNVIGAQPIYASRQGGGALTFAKAVSDWYWSPEDLKSIPPFYRTLTRLELRCSTASERPAISSLLGEAVVEWAAKTGMVDVDFPDMPEAQRSRALKAELAAREEASGP